MIVFSRSNAQVFKHVVKLRLYDGLVVKAHGARTLDASAVGLAIQPTLARGLVDQGGQPFDSVFAVALLCTKASGGNNNHTLAGGAAPCDFQQTNPHPFGQRGRARGIKAQLCRRGDLVGILPTGAGCRNVADLQFGVSQRQCENDRDCHGCSIARLEPLFRMELQMDLHSTAVWTRVVGFRSAGKFVLSGCDKDVAAVLQSLTDAC